MTVIPPVLSDPALQSSPIAQSNPVLFVLIGEASALAPELSRRLKELRLAAADCVIVPGTDFTHLRMEINRIQQDFLAYCYTTVGLARVAYVLHDASYLIGLRAHVENILSPLYPSGLLTDIYWLADESGTLEADIADRVNSMAVLRDGLDEAQTYLLSNLNSASRHVPWADVLQTIALLALFKDGVPPQYPVSPDASRYSEYLFRQNAAPRTGKPFFTAGSARLQIPINALRALLMAALLSPLPLGMPHPPPVVFPKAVPHKYEDEFIEGLALPPEAPHIINGIMRRRTILSRLFGTRLDTINAMHPPAVTDNDFAALEKSLDPYGLFEALEITRTIPGDKGTRSATVTAESIRLTTEDTRPTAGGTRPTDEGARFTTEGIRPTDIAGEGPWPAVITREITANEAALTAARQSLETWLDTPQRIKNLNTDRRTLAVYYKIPHYPYTLAAEYLKRTADIRAHEALAEKLQGLRAFIEMFHTNLQERHAAINDVRAAYEADAQGLNLSATPLAETSHYFADLFARHARTHAQTLHALTLPYRTHIPLDALEKYIENNLLTDPAFARSFPEMLAQVADAEAITNWVTESRHTHIRLRTGSDALYTETLLHLTPDWAAQVKHNCEQQGQGRTNLFADPQAGRVNVLYQAGAFGPGDIYYAGLYESEQILDSG